MQLRRKSSPWADGKKLAWHYAKERTSYTALTSSLLNLPSAGQIMRYVAPHSNMAVDHPNCSCLNPNFRPIVKLTYGIKDVAIAIQHLNAFPKTDVGVWWHRIHVEVVIKSSLIQHSKGSVVLGV